MKVLVFDSNSIVNRAFYGIKLLSTKDGRYTNAIHGFFNIVLKLIDDLSPDCVIFAFDLKAPTFRHEMFEGYKAQRKGMPQELAEQLPEVKKIIRLLGYPILEKDGFEADDILGTIARISKEKDARCLLATGDRDSLQLVNENVTVILASTAPGGAQYVRMDPEAIKEKYSVEPRQLIDVKALMGDASDNIPGVKGIGEKTAFALIQKYGTLDKIYEDIDAIETTPSVRQKLAAGKAMAFLSRALGEISSNVPVNTDLKEYIRKAVDNDELYRLLSSLEMHKLIARLKLTAPLAPAADIMQGNNAHMAKTYKAIMAEELPEFDREMGIAFHSGDDGILFLAAAFDEEILIWERPDEKLLKELFESPAQKYTAQSKPLHKMALSMKTRVENLVMDCSLAGYLLSPSSTEYSPSRLMGEYAIDPPKIEGDIPEELLETALEAAEVIELGKCLADEIENKNQHMLFYDVEMPLAEVLADMELAGFLIDLDGIARFGEELDGLIDELEGRIYELSGEHFNINSPKQMGEVLFEKLGLPAKKKTKSGYSTSAEVLEELAPYHPVIGAILDYRKYSKLRSTYVEGLQKAAGPDGRIHTSFNQTETRTGRISSAEPNMQNIPIRTAPGNRMRKFFLAAPGNILADADYSQIELRVLAALADDKNMTEAFKNGEDIHTNTASQVFDLPPLFVTPTMRSRAKAVNFGIVYGIGAFSLSKDIGVSVSEADSYIKNYLRTYSGVKNYMEKSVKDAEEKGYAQTYFGRRRYLPELRSTNHNLKSFGRRVAMNMPIQGTAADIIKIAMVRVYRRLQEEGMRAKLILQVHDELILEAPIDEAEQAQKILREEMEGAVKFSVPMEAEVKIGADWQEAH